jgi:hypothetical protein
MFEQLDESRSLLNRRTFLQAGALGLALGAKPQAAFGQDAKPPAVDKSKPTKFQVACMTLPYAAFPLERALTGLKAAGYHYVAWGTSHDELGNGKRVSVLAGEAPRTRPRNWRRNAVTSVWSR